MNKERVKVLNELVRWSSNTPVNKTEAVDFQDPFGEDGRNIMEETPPKKKGAPYLLGVISRALSAQINGVEKDKHPSDVRLFEDWFKEKTSGISKYTDQDLQGWVADWLQEGKQLLIGDKV